MSNYKLVDADQLDTDLKAVADKIREKGNTTDELSFPQGYTDAIDAIKTGGGGAAEDKHYVNFYDYEGTLLYSYSKDEVEALTELPPLPSHDGLICQGWNWSLEDIKAEGKETDVGAMYITDDGKTRLYITIGEGRTTARVGLKLNGTVLVDWGDETTPDTITGTVIGAVSYTPFHEYAKHGDYVVTLAVDGEAYIAGTSSLGSLIFSGSGSDYNKNSAYLNAVKRIEIGNNITKIDSSGLSNCRKLSSVTIPESIVTLGGSALSTCYSIECIVVPKSVLVDIDIATCISLKTMVLPKLSSSLSAITCMSDMNTMPHITIPSTVTKINNTIFRNNYMLDRIELPANITYIGSDAFRNCWTLKNIVIPDKVTSIGESAFNGCYNLTFVKMGESVTNIGSSAFSNCPCVKFYDFSKHTAVPTLAATSAFSGIPSDCEIRVPAALYDEWIAATNWSTYASQIVAV